MRPEPIILTYHFVSRTDACKLFCNSQAEEALDFLRSREDFWEQVDVGKESGGLNQGPGGRKRQTSTSKVLQSTRLTYI